MKTNIAVINSLGFTDPGQKCAYAAWVLDACTLSNPQITVSTAVSAVAARAAIVAQTAKPARAASVAVTVAANTVGYAFGELYLNSPAYPIGTAIPAIPAKPASVAVAASPAILASPAVAAVMAPAVAAVKGWDMAINITVVNATTVTIDAYLPVSQNIAAIGGSTTSVSAIGEITPSALSIDKWLGTKASTTPTTAVASTEPATLEQYFYKYAKELAFADSANNTISDIIYTVVGVPTACKHIQLALSATNYAVNSKLLQLDKLSQAQLPQ